ncbi:MAG: hypothetical protein ACRD1R_08495 [Acidobacteriota bacterium]
MDLLIISDLHLSQGRDPVSGRVFRHEDFFFDDDFVDFLYHHQHAPRWRNHRWRLIINGDFLDFLQVTAVPPERHGPASRYGLKAGEEETAWKLKIIMQGHYDFFQALAEFTAEHSLTIVLGNHDIELWYPQVREMFVSQLQARLPEKSLQIGSNIDILPWFYFDGQVYAEHGHQYDKLNSFKHPLDPRLPKIEAIRADEQDHIDLPWGSFFVRYLFNRVELDIPDADNIKPATRFLSWFIRTRPGRAYQFLLGDGREMLRRMKGKWQTFPESAYVERIESQRKALQEMAGRLALLDAENGNPDDAQAEHRWLERLRALDELHEPPVMRKPRGIWRLHRFLTGSLKLPVLVTLLLVIFLFGVVLSILNMVWPALPATLTTRFSPDNGNGIWLEIIRWVFLMEVLVLAGWFLKRRLAPGAGNSTPYYPLRQKAILIEKLLHPQFIVMGHTHEPDLCKLPGGAEYFNTGTWTKIFDEQNRLIRAEKEFVFLRILRDADGVCNARLLKWEGERGKSRLVYLFSS